MGLERSLELRITELFNNTPATGYTAGHQSVFAEFKQKLNSGEIRAASKQNGAWQVHVWVKQGILLGFRMGELADFSVDKHFRYFDKHTLEPRSLTIRDGVYLGRGVTCMPPMYINIGAYVDDGTMVDSHALVGSCAQVGKRVHLSAGSQVGGVLEPVGALPVIVEDDVLVGGNCGIYEGAVVREGAVLAAGTILTGGTPVYDLVNETVYRRRGDQPLEIPARAVVVPGARAITQGWGHEQGLSVYTPVIVKYRDAKTERSIQLEDLLR